MDFISMRHGYLGVLGSEKFEFDNENFLRCTLGGATGRRKSIFTIFQEVKSKLIVGFPYYGFYIHETYIFGDFGVRKIRIC